MRVSGTVSEVVPKNPLDVSKTSFHVPTTTLGVSNTRSGWSRNSEFGYRIGGLGGPNTRLLIHPFRVCMYMCCSAKSFGNDVSGFGFRDGFVFRIRDGSDIRDSGWLRVLDSGFGYRTRGLGGPDASIAKSFEFDVSGFGIRDSGFGFWDSGCEIRDSGTVSEVWAVPTRV